MVDYYEILGIKSTASLKEIKSAYKSLARVRHPDLNGGSAEAAREFVEISSARDVLTDPKRRKEYDEQRRAWAAKGHYAAVVNPTGETYVRRARSEARIKKNLENFLIVEREESRALQQAVYPIVAFLFSAFFVPLVRPHFWHSSGFAGRSVMVILFTVGTWHTVSRISAAIKTHTHKDASDAEIPLDDEIPKKPFARRPAYFLVGFASIGCALLGFAVGSSLSDSLLSAMPMFFDSAIRPELLLYPPVIVLLIDTVHSLSLKVDI